jgi:hypothetical protein
MRYLGHLGLLLGCVGIVLLVEKDVGGIADVRAMGGIDVLFLMFYALLLLGLLRTGVRSARTWFRKLLR